MSLYRGGYSLGKMEKLRVWQARLSSETIALMSLEREKDGRSWNEFLRSALNKSINYVREKSKLDRRAVEFSERQLKYERDCWELKQKQDEFLLLVPEEVLEQNKLFRDEIMRKNEMIKEKEKEIEVWKNRYFGIEK